MSFVNFCSTKTQVAERNTARRICPYMLLGRERGDYFFEALVAAQRIPKRQQLQFPVVNAAWKAAGAGKLFAGEIVIAGPGSDCSQTHDHARAAYCIFVQREQLHGAPTLAQCFLLSPKRRVD